MRAAILTIPLTLLLAAPAAASPLRLEVGPVAGAVALDPALADYRWDTRPGLEADEGAYVIAPDRQGIMGTPVLVYRANDGTASNEKRLTWPELRSHLLSEM